MRKTGLVHALAVGALLVGCNSGSQATRPAPAAPRSSSAAAPADPGEAGDGTRGDGIPAGGRTPSPGPGGWAAEEGHGAAGAGRVAWDRLLQPTSSAPTARAWTRPVLRIPAVCHG